MTQERFAPVPRIATPDFDTLREEFLLPNRPVVLTDFADRWTALNRWTPEFFTERYGERVVQVYNDTFQKPGAHYLKSLRQMTFGEYLDHVGEGPTDLRLFLFELFKFAPELRHDIEVPRWLSALDRQFIVTFFGGPGGVTTFHHDVDLPHVFHVVLHGSKDFYLFAPSETKYLYPHPMTVRSYVDVVDPDLQRHPRFARAQGQYCRVRRGETLVIPSGQWHQVRYPERSWGLSLRKYEPRRIVPALYNMLIQEPIDRALDKLAPQRWFAFKERWAARASRGFAARGESS